MLLLLTSGWLAYRAVGGVLASAGVRDQVVAEQRAAETLLATMGDAETGQRGYLLTGDAHYLEPFNTARARLDNDIAQLDAARPADLGETGQLSTIVSLSRAKLAELMHTVALRQTGHDAEALAVVHTGLGERIMESLRAEAAGLRVRSDARSELARTRGAAVRNWLYPAATMALAGLLLAVASRYWLRKWRNLSYLAGQERFTRAFGLTRGMLRDTDGRITFWGAGMTALYGFTPAMAVGRISHELLSTHLPAPLKDIEAALLRDGDWHGELINRCADGTLRSVVSHWVLHRDSINGKLSVVEMEFDIGSVRQADPHRQLALETAEMGTWIWDVGGTGAMVWDARCIALVDPPAGVTPTFELWREAAWPEDLAAVEAKLACMLDPFNGTDHGHWEFRLARTDGQMIWLASTGHVQFVRAPGAPGGRVAVRMAGTVRDISAEKAGTWERERMASLLRTIVETTPGPIYAKNRSGQFLLANAAALALIGKPWSEVDGRTDLDVLNDPEQAAAILVNDQRIMASGQVEAVEEIVDYNGQTRAWLSTKSPMHAADGSVIGLVGVSVEITERKRDEARRTLMIHELNHRVKNTLATVQAVVSETMRDAEPVMRAALDGRLLALASVHDVLTRESWHSAELGEVVADALAPFGGGSVSRFRVQGPKLLLQPRAAVALAMGLHELATNASKYGALSAESGIVTFTWELLTRPGYVTLTWTEAGGPPVLTPTRRSFGSNMIEDALASDLCGTAIIHFDAAGVRCVIEASLDEVIASPEVITLPPVGLNR